MDDSEKAKIEAAEQARVEYERYKAYVAGVVAANDGKETIQNKTPEHAGVLFAALFAQAKESIRIMSGALHDTAFGCEDVTRSAIEFLGRPGTAMTVVVEQPITVANNKFLTAIHDAGLLHRIVFRRATQPLPFHLALADNSHYRFEENTEKCEAIAQFGMSDLGSLNNSFQKALDDSIPYQM